MNAASSSAQLGAMDLYHALPCPEGWVTRRLRFFTRINKAQPITLAPEDEVSFVPMAAIGEHGGIQLDQVKALDEVGDGYTYFADSDVVVAKITPCFENGKGAFAKGLRNGIAFGTTELHVIRPADDIDGRFLFYLSISELFRKLGEGAMYGAGGQKRVPDLFIKDFQALVPPLDQQQKIAAFLDRKTAEIDTLIAKKRRLLDRLAEKRTALITRAVTKGLNPDAPMKDSGIEWLGEIPAHWDVMAIKWITPVLRGASPRPIDDPIYFDDEGEYSWVRIADVTASEMRLEKTTQRLSELGASLSVKRHPGDLFLSIAGSVGKPIIAGIKCCIHDGFVYFPRIPPELSEYLFWIFKSGQPYLGLGKLGTQLNLNTDTVGGIRIALPPADEVHEIVDWISGNVKSLDEIHERISNAIVRLEEYRSALITNAVTGQIKVA
ncbi:restriction endonuclease subunit S [Saccharospirillum salsuginis]|uniref:Restriction modification system DNA specificity domain-containing protein n=1 Tax=Saccharospirillum salsuginis TaxID=418750 RepID=A0A918KRB6_9GAMM|nr:restriction endonuclease subunit S [Saccharospirillum salsuginis]GGX73055.1 restriction modification system DNA specificity domain-containing protein [Saccharospirillum salsuginis]